MKLRIAAVLLVACLALAPTAAAHASKTSGDGKVRVTWGWTGEPAVTMTKNGLDLIIRDNATGAGIGGLENADLEVSIHHGEDELHVETLATQFGKGPGNYTASHAITPTKPGLYTLHVRGTIAGSQVDLEIPATHEMEAIEETYFPEMASGDAAALAQKVATLEQKVAALEAKAQAQSTRPTDVTPQTGGANDAPGFGLLAALAAAGLALVVLRRRA